MKHLFKILVFIIFVSLPQIPVSNSLFNAQDIVPNNQVSVGDWLKLDFYLTPDAHHVGFKVSGIDHDIYNTLDYLITYDSDQTTQGIKGARAIGENTEISENNLLLGFCTTGGTCVDFTGVKNIKITVTLTGIGPKTSFLTSEVF